MSHKEEHRSHRVGWLRAAVLGANDGIVSTASLIIGVASASTGHEGIILAGGAGLVAGAMSMAAGEYISVSTQSDTEKADLALEKKSLAEDFGAEKKELAEIYEKRGLDPLLAEQVAEQLMVHDALGTHAKDEIGITEVGSAHPVQAAFSSAAAFTAGAALPLMTAWAVPVNSLIPIVSISSLIFLVCLGAIAAFIGGSSITIGAVRVSFWGALAMTLTAIVGRMFGVNI